MCSRPDRGIGDGRLSPLTAIPYLTGLSRITPLYGKGGDSILMGLNLAKLNNKVYKDIED
jgi:hypothetical protein